MIDLYMWESCPFCRKVLQAADRMGLREGEHYRVINAAPGTPGRDVVAQKGGKAMVPFLVDGATYMYESDDIIEYLRKNAKG
ncbi:glutathione S-transferase N-terminal domain-containing protein [Desulfopila inferna]|uniref:glutathione S-transferase N-terminal domain-containing protein n=1 Tax=Desulfopila inferna TaxID=468528 RepID=UPI0019623DBC|nr:glutathione S-transferase N-terminal domain-containing protein [Desulfopila inferna]MBM9606281.1 glutathione S-transferase N-terminal domain-containing protein [Desulfopila inferna]